MEGDRSRTSSAGGWNPRKRTFAELSTPRPRSTQYVPLHLNSDSSLSEAPSASLNRNFPPPPPSRSGRHYGDGLDLERSIISQQHTSISGNHPTDEVIDLTSDSEVPISFMRRETPLFGMQDEVITPATMPEVIDLVDDDDLDDDQEDHEYEEEEEVIPTVTREYIDLEADEEVQLLRVQPLIPPSIATEVPNTAPNISTSREPHSHWLHGGSLMNQFTTGISNQFQRSTGISTFQQLTHTFLGRASTLGSTGDPYALLDDIPRPPFHRRPNQAATDWLHGPLGMDYDRVAFDLGVDAARPDPPVPPPSKYDPLAPAAEGFTRTPKAGEVIVCPSCNHELGKGKDPEQKQIWALRNCGHVYCGKCIKARAQKRRMLSKCVADGCNNKFGTSRKYAVMLYLS